MSTPPRFVGALLTLAFVGGCSTPRGPVDVESRDASTSVLDGAAHDAQLPDAQLPYARPPDAAPWLDGGVCVSRGDRLRGYWQFEGNGIDSSGAGRDLELIGAPGFAAGVIGQALNLRGNVAQYADRAGNDDEAFDFGADSFTIQAWVAFHSFDGEQVLVEKLTGGAGPGWSLTKFEGGRIHFGVDGVPVFNEHASLTLERWHHIVVRRVATHTDLFVDASLVSTAMVQPTIGDSGDVLLVGRRHAADGRGFALNGRLDEVAIWARELSDAEIAVLYNSGSGALLCE